MSSEKEAKAAAPSAPLHEIQLDFVVPRELTIKVNEPKGKAYSLPDGSVKLTGGVSAVGADRRFMANACATIGDPEFTGEYPIYMKVDLVGGFVITKEEVSDEAARQWATRAAQFTLMPYLREHVHSLTSRAGFDPVLIPLIQLPNFTAPSAGLSKSAAVDKP